MTFRDILVNKLLLDLGSEPFDGSSAPIETFEIRAKGSGIVCGLRYIPTIIDIVEKVFFLKSAFVRSPAIIRIILDDGAVINPNTVVAILKGNSEVFLKSERTILNILSELSGIAAYTRKQVEKVKKYNVALLDTRKDDPLMRAMHKYAITIGGGKPHRFGFFDGLLIKDNDIAVYGGVTKAINQHIRSLKHLTKIEVEIKNLTELDEVLKDGRADVIMLDNINPKQLIEAVKQIKASSKQYDAIEASGINENDFEKVAQTGVTHISTSLLVRRGIGNSIDFSMKVVKNSCK